jgi:hypothetical protein
MKAKPRNLECPATGTACEDGACKRGLCQIEERERQLLEMQERERQERERDRQEIDWDEIVRRASERWRRMTKEQQAAFAARLNRRRVKSIPLH